ncbi:unnamed protein product, partial [Prorocentrum cordatum]
GGLGSWVCSVSAQHASAPQLFRAKPFAALFCSGPARCACPSCAGAETAGAGMPEDKKESKDVDMKDADADKEKDDGAKKEEKKEPPKDPKTLLIEQLSQTLRTISACVAAGETRAMGRVIRTFASTRRTMMPE